MNLTATVSIITPVRNAAETLRETVASIISQSFCDWELWLVDDASSDNSPSLIKELCSADERIRGLSLQSHGGAAAARNLAISHATGRYIAFLDADDLWDRHKLAVQLRTIPEGTGLSYSSYRRIDMNGKVLGFFNAPASLDYADALCGNSIGCLTAIYDTHVYGKVFMPNIPRRQDYALWLKLIRQEGPARGVQEYLASYRVRNNSLSSNWPKSAKATWRVFRECERLSRKKSSWCFCQYAFSAARKRFT